MSEDDGNVTVAAGMHVEIPCASLLQCKQVLYLLHLTQAACMQVRVVRIFNTYGPRMALDDGRVVSNFVAQALTDQPLTVYGDGQQTRSFQYVSDLIKGTSLNPSYSGHRVFGQHIINAVLQVLLPYCCCHGLCSLLLHGTPGTTA